MKQMVQKIAVLCVLASTAGLVQGGYERKVTNPTPYKALVTLDKVSCNNEEREIQPYQTVTFNSDACTVRRVFGQVYYKNSNLINATTGEPFAQWIKCINNWYSKGGGWGTISFKIMLNPVGRDGIPTFSIVETQENY